VTAQAESIIVCEGYHDRAFLESWLKARKCESFKDKNYPPNKNGPLRGGGQFGFRTLHEHWVRIVPAGGDANAFDVAFNFVEEAKTRPVERIIVVLDDDSEAPQTGSRVASFNAWTERCGAKRPAGVDPELSDGILPTKLFLILWSAQDEPAEVLPNKQTLERLACAAIRAVHPDRCRAVSDWLRARPSPPEGEKSHKSHAASHMAGWFSDRGSEAFFGAIWEDERVREELEGRLEAVGAGTVIDALVGQARSGPVPRG
jgi:hypothetical protein